MWTCERVKGWFRVTPSQTRAEPCFISLLCQMSCGIFFTQMSNLSVFTTHHSLQKSYHLENSSGFDSCYRAQRTPAAPWFKSKEQNVTTNKNKAKIKNRHHTTTTSITCRNGEGSAETRPGGSWRRLRHTAIQANGPSNAAYKTKWPSSKLHFLAATMIQEKLIIQISDITDSTTVNAFWFSDCCWSLWKMGN